MIALIEELLVLAFRLFIHLMLAIFAVPFFLFLSTPIVLFFALFGRGSYRDRVHANYGRVRALCLHRWGRLGDGKPRLEAGSRVD